ncbi:tRNA(Ile)(2)-agmatinylcytidine synthase [Methanogenium organophilum]|uniref:tRNA(Ile2) 2-agmatinylcytidine synthetase TiaS n=1 Tax=Methanogenium organophilum TaxID=2199 RepID=A0A9X9S2J3_METOG|nr:tRNA(Ile)(2)-agmatinylcytidine synthase [Methanogenium organophilum]WAI00366.1 tRNA(Ile)(2)-agmatinylcytidine synthase [Methanogenium organophilum]
MRIGIDDTDSPAGMCTTYLGAVLIHRLTKAGIQVTGQSLIRLNPNVIYKTRGNAAICIDAEGDAEQAFRIASACIEELAEFDEEKTNPGLVVAENPFPVSFYRQAVTGFCTINEAEAVCHAAGARTRKWKNGRGIIGATAAVAAKQEDMTWELLAYRNPEDKGERMVERESLFRAEKETFPHTWDTVDIENDCIVCFPHTPDPVIFGIRGESPEWVIKAREYVRSQKPVMEVIYHTNQGTDAHLLEGEIGSLAEGCSYRLRGVVADIPETGRGGHVSFHLRDMSEEVRCMAYEPTKGFRDVIRGLAPGDGITICGSYKNGSINLEKIRIITCPEIVRQRPPLCPSCGKRMKSDGVNKGWKCRRCKTRAEEPEIIHESRTVSPGWYEVPPSARRHLVKPLCRGTPTE